MGSTLDEYRQKMAALVRGGDTSWVSPATLEVVQRSPAIKSSMKLPKGDGTKVPHKPRWAKAR
jgi:hypothetical protein